MITLEELEAMHADMVAMEADRDLSIESIELVIDFTTKLSAFLEGQGFHNSYIPYRQYPQTLKVTIGHSVRDDGGGTGLLTYSNRVWVETRVMYCNGAPVTTVGELLESLQKSRTSYQSWLVERAKRDAIVKYCQDCWYADDDAQYCGLGREMSMQCHHRVIKDHEEQLQSNNVQ